jgi:hypothetical protein
MLKATEISGIPIVSIFNFMYGGGEGTPYSIISNGADYIFRIFPYPAWRIIKGII